MSNLFWIACSPRPGFKEVADVVEQAGGLRPLRGRGAPGVLSQKVHRRLGRCKTPRKNPARKLMTL